jgi:hypothetical protein
MGSSLYSSPPLSIPTPNPVLKSTVGMIGCGSLRGKASAKACEEVNLCMEESGVSENRRESKPLLWSGSTLHAVPAYSPMPVSKQTVSSGEPSLLLTLNFSPMPPGSTGLSPKSSTGQWNPCSWQCWCLNSHVQCWFFKLCDLSGAFLCHFSVNAFSQRLDLCFLQ